MVTELKIGDSGPDSVTLVCRLMMKPPGGVEALICASAALSVPGPPVVPAEVVPGSLATVTLITVCARASVASAKLAPRMAAASAPLNAVPKRSARASGQRGPATAAAKWTTSPHRAASRAARACRPCKHMIPQSATGMTRPDSSRSRQRHSSAPHRAGRTTRGQSAREPPPIAGALCLSCRSAGLSQLHGRHRSMPGMWAIGSRCQECGLLECGLLDRAEVVLLRASMVSTPVQAKLSRTRERPTSLAAHRVEHARPTATRL